MLRGGGKLSMLLKKKGEKTYLNFQQLLFYNVTIFFVFFLNDFFKKWLFKYLKNERNMMKEKKKNPKRNDREKSFT